MKKLFVLAGMIALVGVAGLNAAQKLKDKHRQKIEQVQWEKINRQRQLARIPVYTMVDASIEDEFEGAKVNWTGVFAVIDSMKGVISVNEYTTFNWGYSLLWLAVKESNVAIAKTLLEKYKANPNLLTGIPYEEGKEEPETMFPLMLACKNDNIAMIKLLLQYGANPNLQNEEGKNSFCYAKNAAMTSVLKKE